MRGRPHHRPPTASLSSISAGGPLRPALAAGLILLITFLAYIPVLRAGFIWDDDTFLTKNALIKATDGLYRFWFTTEATDYYPVVSSTLWLQWRMWGENATGYHVVNVLLHAINSILIWWVLKRLRIPGAWLAGMVFAVHPVNVQSVAWITELKNLLPLLFYLLAILCYLEYEDRQRWKYYGLALVCFLVALLAKASVVMLPVVLLLLAWWRRGRIERRDVLLSVPFFGFSLLLGLVTVWFQYNSAIGSTVIRTDGLFSRLAIAGCAVWFYLYKALLPINLAFVYPRWQLNASIVSLIPAAVLVAGFCLLWRYRRGWGRPVLAAFGYYVLSLLPVLGFLNIYYMRYSFVADYWQYTAIVGVIALVVGLAAHVVSRSTVASRMARGVAGVVVVVLCVLTWRQASTYQNAETVWRDTLAKNPRAFLAHSNYGMILKGRGDFEAAIAHYQAAAALAPDFPEPYINTGVVLARQGKDQQALQFFTKAVEVDPKSAEAHYNLGRALIATSQPAEAVTQFRHAAQIRSGYVEAIVGLGDAMVQTGQIEAGIAEYRSALAIQPDADLFGRLARALVKGRQFRQAEQAYREMLRLDPESISGMNGLAWLLATVNEPEVRNGQEALKLALDASQRTGNREPAILDTLAAAYAATGRFAEAVQTAQKALELCGPQDPQAQEMRARLELYKAGRACESP